MNFKEEVRVQLLKLVIRYETDVDKLAKDLHIPVYLILRVLNNESVTPTEVKRLAVRIDALENPWDDY